MRFVIILLILSFIYGCQSDTPKSEVENEAQIEVINITPDDFKTNPEAYVDKYIKIEGTCVHTCKHGGKRMHIVGPDSEFRIKVEAGKNVIKFDKALEGSLVQVEGYVRVQRVTEDYLNNWENELKDDIEKQEESGEAGEDHAESMEQITNLRMELKKSGKEQISFYSIECSDYKEMKQG
ncbi:MAG: hypothetical protein JW995_05850 [Melioribacteraceae bacterium]|nr:hypothetical protein [Melioribacteraceae bacterium]